MKRSLIMTGIALLALIAVLAIHATGQVSVTVGPKPAAEAAKPCAACMPMMDIDGMKNLTDDQKKELKEKIAKWMKDAGVTEDVVMQCKAMAMAPQYMDSPETLLAMDKMLTLTDDQKAKLMDIQKDARTKAAAVLTDDQKKKLGTVPDKTMTFMDQVKMIHEKMMPVIQKDPDARNMTGCPMMGMQEKPAMMPLPKDVNVN